MVPYFFTLTESSRLKPSYQPLILSSKKKSLEPKNAITSFVLYSLEMLDIILIIQPIEAQYALLQSLIVIP